jgi:NADH dehydrogenase [ubiquinone] 1 alpha subcomplex assembly factor 5
MLLARRCLLRYTSCLGQQQRALSQPSMEVFDRNVKRLQRDAAARAPGAEEFDYLRERVASVLVDRIEDISREFPLSLDMGCHAGHIYKVSAASQNSGHGLCRKHLQRAESEN